MPREVKTFHTYLTLAVFEKMHDGFFPKIDTIVLDRMIIEEHKAKNKKQQFMATVMITDLDRQAVAHNLVKRDVRRTMDIAKGTGSEKIVPQQFVVDWMGGTYPFCDPSTKKNVGVGVQIS